MSASLMPVRGGFASAPRIEGFGGRPDLEIVDAASIDGVGGDRQVDAALEGSGTFDEIAVRLDVGIALPFVDEHVSRDDHHRPGLPVAFLPHA
jgi:hypothetical protein